MPFGKFKGVPIKDVDESYLDWLVEQDWLKDKWPKLHKLLTVGEEESSTPEERKVIADEGPLLDPMPPAFKEFWKRCYGERMRVHGQVQYIAFLRVACTTWKECATACLASPASASVPEAHKPAMLPPPLSHIPAPRGFAPKQPLNPMLSQPLNDGRDEEVGF